MPTTFNPLAYQATEGNTINIALFGDSMVSAYNMADILTEFAAQSGINLNIKSIQYNNAGQVSSGAYYNLFELFRDNTPAENNLKAFDVTGNGGTSTNANAKNMWYLLNRTPNSYQPKAELDYFMIFSSRDVALSGTSKTKNESALTYLDRIFAEYDNTKGTEFVVMASPKYDDSDTSNVKYDSKNQVAINSAADDLAATVGAEVFSIGNGWAYFEENYADSGIDLYDRMISKIDKPLARYPSQAGAYYNACLIYSMLFGKTTTGMPVYGYMTKEEATVIQQAADTYVRSTGKTLINYNTVKPLSLKAVEVYDPDSAETDNGFFKYLLATAAAYDARGMWVQYDQTAMNKYVYNTGINYSYRHDSVLGFASPESATPQDSIYTDCSRWITSLYADVFDDATMRGDSYSSCSKLYTASHSGNLKNAVVYDWVNTQTAPTAEYIESILQPGDMLLYNSDGSGGSHVVLYIGNGMVMHCTGDQAGGGGSDYNTNNNTDNREYVGSIKLDHLDIFTQSWSYRYVFDKYANDTVTIIRPSMISTYGDSKVSAQAKARYEGLLGTVAYKTSTAPDGVTVNSGDSVTFTYTVENKTPFKNRTYTITEVLPEGVTYVSSDGGSYNSGTRTVTINVTLGARETKAVTCTVKVTASDNTSVYFEKSSINGVAFGYTTVEVNGTLTASQQTTVANKAKSLIGGYSDVYSLAQAAYNGTGISLAGSAQTVLNAMFTDYTDYNYQGAHPNQSAYSVFYKAWQVNLSGSYDIIHKLYHSGAGYRGFYGGQCVRRAVGSHHRAQDIYAENLVVGDLILWINREDCYAPGLDATTSELQATDSAKKTAANALTFDNLAAAGKIQSCMYIGNGEFIVKDADGSLTVVGGSVARNLCEQFQGEGLWYLYRPSAK